jgi:hypothetical protein
LRPLLVHQKGEVFLGNDGLTPETLPQEFQKAFPEVSPKYHDSVSLLAGIAAQRAVGGNGMGAWEGVPRDNFAVIVGSAFGSIDPTMEFDGQALRKGPNAVNPMDFPNTVSNAAGSRIGIWLQLKGPNITLTNGGTSLIDAIGFAWEGLNGNLFEHCLVGAVDKLPEFLKPYGTPGASPEYREGSVFLLASGAKGKGFLFQVEDYLSIQLKPGGGLPAAFLGRWEEFWKRVEWLGFPSGTPLENHLPQGLPRHIPDAGLVESGLSGWESLQAFLSSSHRRGALGAFSRPEGKFALIKLDRKET